MDGSDSIGYIPLTVAVGGTEVAGTSSVVEEGLEVGGRLVAEIVSDE